MNRNFKSDCLKIFHHVPVRRLPHTIRFILAQIWPLAYRKALVQEQKAKAAHNLRKYLVRTNAANPNTVAVSFSEEYKDAQRAEHKQFLQQMI